VFSFSTDGQQKYLRVVPTVPVATATTYHVVGTCDGITMKLYVNGVLIGSLDITTGGIPDTDASLVRIGHYNASSNYMNGVIDEVAIYNYALDQQTIQDHYNTGRDIATY
jgi:hypothetical protein